jgi:hypothetical protein
LRSFADPFTVDAPGGARIRDRLHLTEADERVVRLIGRHLGHHAGADLAERVRLGNVTGAGTQRAARKKKLTAVSSSRWAGTITRASEDQYQLSLRCLHQQRLGLRRAIATITQRLGVACGERQGRIRGYVNQNERFQKQRRLQMLKARLARVEDRITQGRPAIVVGGGKLARARHHLEAAQLTQADWQARWDAARVFLTADGESGASFGNYTITVDPHDGCVSIVLPEPLRHLANAPRGRYRLSCTVIFHHRRDEWFDRVQAGQAVRYDIAFAPERARWYLDASWAGDKITLPTPAEVAAAGGRLLGVDLNADHLAACVVDPCGNPVGRPFTVATDLTGPSKTRDGRLRAAITELIRLAREHGCAGLAIEDLGFADARRVGRETMGRGGRGKRFRRTVAGMPTARFRERVRGMAYHAGLVVIAVDPAYTSKWGSQHWRAPLQRQSRTVTVTGHHAGGVAIGRRALGYGIRRRPGVTAPHQRMAGRRATGLAVSRLRACGTADPPRTAGTPSQGVEKTCQVPGGGQLALFPAPRTARGAPGSSPGCDCSVDHGRHR